MLYTNWGTQVKIIANCGEQKPKYLREPSVLVKTERPDGATKYQFDFTLRADNGYAEIEQAIANAPRVELTAQERQVAFRQAE